MRTGTITFLLGILCLVQFADLPDPRFICLLPVLILICFRFPAARPLALFACGFLWALFRAELVLHQSLDQEIEGKTLV
ncbi:MAG: hypothetical protein V3R68_03975, partial [Gammaproteobacteria bacterium]